MQHQRELVNYLEKRASEIQRLRPVLSLYRVDHIATEQLKGIEAIINEVSGSNREDLKVQNINFIMRNYAGLQTFLPDVESLLATGKTVLPENLSDFRGYFEEQARNKAEAERLHYEELKRQNQEARQKRLQERKQREQAELAEKLGLNSEVLQKLQ